MKTMTATLVTSLLLSSLSLFAESDLSEEIISPSITLFAEEEQGEIASLAEELTLLDEEFDEFKNDLFAPDEATESAAANQVLNPLFATEQLDGFEEEIAIANHPFEIELSEEEAHTQEIAEAPRVDITSLDAIEQQANLFTPEDAAIAAVRQIEETEPAILNIDGTAFMGEISSKSNRVSIDLKSAFSGSPIIYTLLFAMSVAALCIWLYCVQRLRTLSSVSEALKRNLSNKLNSNHFEEALSLCNGQYNLFSKMVATGIQSRRHGLPIMIESMKAEGKRATVDFWQKLGMLNDIAIIAPMIGLLGTVLGMFYAFYNINRSIESVSTLFDGLGVSVGTTVAGLIVAILALMLHSTAKYKLVKALTTVENEAQNIAIIVDDRTSIHNKG